MNVDCYLMPQQNTEIIEMKIAPVQYNTGKIKKLLTANNMELNKPGNTYSKIISTDIQLHLQSVILI